MGWGWRKSKKIGPVRISLGKRGLGASIGVKGARIGVSSDGRSYASASIPGTGLTYRTGLGGGGGSSARGPSPGSGPPSSWRSTLGCLCLIAAPVLGFLALFFGFLDFVAGAASAEGPNVILAVFAIAVALSAVGLVIGGIALFAAERAHRRAMQVQREEMERLAEIERVRAQEEWTAQAREREAARRQALVANFGEDAAAAIIARRLWVGAPEAAVHAMFGPPDAIDERAMRKALRRVLKYRDPSHAGRWERKVTVEDGHVVGWEER